MTQTGMAKRSREEVDNELLNLNAQQLSDKSEQQKKKRRRQYAPMTQYSNNGATQNGDKDANNNTEKYPAGYIKKITLKNFMSHENFEMEFGPRLNFIVGNNGSGKSAILTAITIGLGAKASETNRGNSLRDLIREGCNSSRITIHLENESYGAYQDGIYGKEIIIERTLRRDGPASFSLKSENGKEISNKKKDIQTIVDYFSIPISNPMCFLSQDAARSFLTASTPQDKYNHFMKGTLLSEIVINLDKAENIRINSEANMALHLENLKILKREYEESKDLVKDLDQTSNLHDRKRLLQGKSLWIDIKDNNNSVNKLNEDIKVYENKHSETNNKIKARKDKIERYKADNELTDKDVELKIVDIREKDQKHQDVRNELREIRNKYEKIKMNKDEAITRIKECQIEIGKLTKTIEKIEDELRKQIGGDKEQMREELLKLVQKNEDLTNTINTLTPKIRDLENEERNISNRRNTEIDKIEKSIQSNRSELHKISRGNNSLLSNFDPNMENLLKMINREAHRFTTLPIGPLGKYLSIKDEFKNWARPIQRYLSSSLGSFVVSNVRDNRLLRELIAASKVRLNIGIITYRFENFDIGGSRSVGKYPNVHDALNFTDNRISGLLADLNRIEKVVLIKDKDEARNFLRSNPRNVQMALSLRDQSSGFQLSTGYRLDTIVYENRLKLKIGSSSDNGTTFIREQITREEQELQKIKDNYERQLNDTRAELQALKRKAKESDTESNRNSGKITQLRINVDKVVDSGVLTSKVNERTNQEQAILGYESAIKELDAQMDTIKKETVPIRERYDETKLSFSNASTELQHLRESINTRMNKMRRYEDDIKHYEDRNAQFQDGIKKIKANIEVLETGIQEQITEALKFATKEEVQGDNFPESQEAIKRELNKIANEIQRVEREIGISPADILKLFEDSMKKYKDGHSRYKAVNNALLSLKESIEKRRQTFDNLRAHTCLEADFDFKSSIRERKFAGNLLFIEDTKSLEIYILTPNDEKARNVDTLSGGEKSFSQMALLLATWKPMRSRIIALDEFDVFMDQVNRKVGTTLIIKKLENEYRTQTIIITPQDIGKIAEIDSSSVKIHRMKDPERQNNSNFHG